LYGVARRDDLAAKAYPLHRLDDREPFADAIGIAEEGSEVLLLAGASVEHTGLGKDRACRRRSGVEQLKLELDRDLVVIHLATQRVEAKLKRRPKA
jgi:hypothetical protein